jgi:hypothetical protein
MIDEKQSREVLKKKDDGLIDVLTRLLPGETKKIMKKNHRTVGVPAGFRIKHLQNTYFIIEQFSDDTRSHYAIIIYLWPYSPLDVGRFIGFLIYTQTVGLLGRGISPLQSRYLHT